MSAPHTFERRASKRLEKRQAPYAQNEQSTGLTKYMEEASLNWNGEASHKDSLTKVRPASRTLHCACAAL